MKWMIALSAAISFLLICNTVAYPKELTSNTRDSYNREDPDAILNGFFPFWGILLFILSGSALALTGFALLGYLIGCRTPRESRQPSTDSTAPFYVIQNCALAI